MGLVNEMILIERIGKPDELLQAKPDIMFPIFFALWHKMQVLEENGVRVYGEQQMRFPDMELRDMLSYLNHFIVFNDDSYAHEPQFGNLRVEWSTGNLNIALEEFFPCETWRLKRLMSIIRLDKEHRVERIVQLRLFFMKQILKYEHDCEFNRSDFVKEYRLLKGGEKLVETGCFPDGSKLDDAQLRYYEGTLCEHKTSIYTAIGRSQDCMHKKIWFIQHINEVK